jgi:hypothetical protein
VKDAGLTLQVFRNPDELARQVERSLTAMRDRLRAESERVQLEERPPFMAEDLPQDFVQRPREFEALRSRLLDQERRDPLAITGTGGFGKTTLALALCHDEQVIQAFKDGILWTTLGESPSIADSLAKLYAELTGDRPAFKDAEDAAIALAKQLEQKTCLIVIDDVWDPAHLRPFPNSGGLDRLQAGGCW